MLKHPKKLYVGKKRNDYVGTDFSNHDLGPKQSEKNRHNTYCASAKNHISRLTISPVLAGTFPVCRLSHGQSKAYAMEGFGVNSPLELDVLQKL